MRLKVSDGKANGVDLDQISPEERIRLFHQVYLSQHSDFYGAKLD